MTKMPVGLKIGLKFKISQQIPDNRDRTISDEALTSLIEHQPYPKPLAKADNINLHDKTEFNCGSIPV